MKYKLIAAISSNRGIGTNGTLPWRIKEDLSHFSKTTKGNGNNAIIMGRKTWKSLNEKMLVGRDNLILSSTINIDDCVNGNIVKTFDTTNSLDCFIDERSYDEVWVIGGGEIYKNYIQLEKVDTCLITVIDKEYNCDTYFPSLNNKWNNIENNIIKTQQGFEIQIKKFTLNTSSSQNMDYQ